MAEPKTIGRTADVDMNICQRTTATDPVIMDRIPAFFVAFGTAKPRPYAAKGPAERSAKAKRLSVTSEIWNKAIAMLIRQMMILLILVYLMIFRSSNCGLTNFM